LGIGDWGLGDWGLGAIPNPQYIFHKSIKNFIFKNKIFISNG